MSSLTSIKTNKGSIVVEWSSDQRSFTVQSLESMAAQFPPSEASQQHIVEDAQTNAQELSAQIQRFQQCNESEDVSTAISEMQLLRAQVLVGILTTPTPLRWLPNFLTKWRTHLRAIGEHKVMATISSDLVKYCQELVALAGGWKLIGDIVEARATLGKCFEAIRRHLKAPFAPAKSSQNNESQALRQVAIDAKQLLLKCVAFQASLNRTKELAERHDAPPQVLASLSKQFWSLYRQAPFSIEIAILLANSLMRQRQHALLTRFLDRPLFHLRNAELTLIHARALAYVGFYRQSLQVSQSFMSQEVKRKDEEQFLDALRNHNERLKELLDRREEADKWLLAEQFDKAIRGYDASLALTEAADHKLIAVLLFGRANALLGVENLREAIKDLERSLQLDPSNKVASLRLKTARLQLETERIRKELSGNKLSRTRA